MFNDEIFHIIKNCKNRPRFFSVFILLGIYNFDIPGEKRTTESTTNIFQKISIIDSQVNEKVYFQDEQPVATSTIKVPFDNGFLSKDIVNSEPLSTIKERGMYPKYSKSKRVVYKSLLVHKDCQQI